LAAKGEFKMMLVSNTKYNDPLMAVWRGMTATDSDYASNPAIVHDIHSASRALGLSAVDADYARVWIESRTERMEETYL